MEYCLYSVSFIRHFNVQSLPLVEMKLIFVSGGVISGLGKGITASSIGRLLESRDESGVDEQDVLFSAQVPPQLSRYPR